MSWNNRQKRVLFLSKSQVSRTGRHGPETSHNSRGNRHTHRRDLVPHVYSLVIKRHTGENSRIDPILTEPFPYALLILVRRRLTLPCPDLPTLWNITHVRIVSVLEFGSVLVCVYTQIIVVSGNKQKRPTKLFKVCRGHLFLTNRIIPLHQCVYRPRQEPQFPDGPDLGTPQVGFLWAFTKIDALPICQVPSRS